MKNLLLILKQLSSARCLTKIICINLSLKIINHVYRSGFQADILNKYMITEYV